MLNFIHDVINDPREYWPFLLMVGLLLVLWSGLCISAALSLRAATSRWRLGLGLPPLLLGLLGVLARIPISLEAEGFRFHCDLRWMFLLPLIAGLLGLRRWWFARKEKLTQPVP